MYGKMDAYNEGGGPDPAIQDLFTPQSRIPTDGKKYNNTVSRWFILLIQISCTDPAENFHDPAIPLFFWSKMRSCINFLLNIDASVSWLQTDRFIDEFDKNHVADLDFMIGLSERTATVVANDVIFMSLISIFLDNCL